MKRVLGIGALAFFVVAALYANLSERLEVAEANSLRAIAQASEATDKAEELETKVSDLEDRLEAVEGNQ